FIDRRRRLAADAGAELLDHREFGERSGWSQVRDTQRSLEGAARRNHLTEHAGNSAFGQRTTIEASDLAQHFRFTLRPIHPPVVRTLDVSTLEGNPRTLVEQFDQLPIDLVDRRTQGLKLFIHGGVETPA